MRSVVVSRARVELERRSGPCPAPATAASGPASRPDGPRAPAAPRLPARREDRRREPAADCAAVGRRQIVYSQGPGAHQEGERGRGEGEAAPGQPDQAAAGRPPSERRCPRATREGDRGQQVADPPKPVLVRRAARFITPAEQVRPPYPVAKQRLEEEASLRLALAIDARGRATSVSPVGAADPVFLDAARRQSPAPLALSAGERRRRGDRVAHRRHAHVQARRVKQGQARRVKQGQARGVKRRRGWRCGPAPSYLGAMSVSSPHGQSARVSDEATSPPSVGGDSKRDHFIGGTWRCWSRSSS